MTDINKLKGKLVENKLTIKRAAERINIDTATFYRRMANQGENFTIKEAAELGKALNLSSDELTDIFFADFVAQNATKQQ